jgi:hypothetical protein
VRREDGRQHQLAVQLRRRGCLLRQCRGCQQWLHGERTFSLPESVAPNGDKALYDCPASTSNGAYAQCDGGLCFTSTEGQSFSGFAEPLNEGQVICSCPTVVANPATAVTGYQIAGPYPCESSFFANCDSATAHTNTGSTTYVGAPTGSAAC